MHIVIYLGLNCLYFIFGVLLINTIRKEFLNKAKEKTLLEQESPDIFFPQVREKNSYYLHEIMKKKKKPKYIFILPHGEMLVRPGDFWNLFSTKYYHNLEYIHNFIVPSYSPGEYMERRRLEKDIYTCRKFPLVFILRHYKEDNIIFMVNSKKEYYDLQAEFRKKSYQLIQKIDSSIYSYQKKIFVIESFMLVIKEQKNISIYRYPDFRYLLLDLKKNNLIHCRHMARLFSTVFFEKPFENMIASMDKNYQFLLANLTDMLAVDFNLLGTTFFEVFSVKYIMDSSFRLYIYQIDQKIDIENEEDSKLYKNIISETFKIVKNTEKEESNLIPIVS